MWYEARGDKLREPTAVRPAESNANSRAIISKLGLPVGSYRGLGIRVVDELGQLGEEQAQVHAEAASQGYSKFPNVIINDTTKTKHKAAAGVWKKVTSLFGKERGAKHDRSLHDLAAEPEKRRRGLEIRFLGASALV
jgi:hypothetical protein